MSGHATNAAQMAGFGGQPSVGGQHERGIVASNIRQIAKGTLVEVADLTVLAWHLTIRGAMRHEKNGKCWVQLPSREWIDAKGQRQFAPLVEFTDRATSDRFQAAALAAFDVARAAQ
jgi:hypothetical protein